MTRKFNCLNCGSEIRVRFLKAGEVARCKACGAGLPVPEEVSLVHDTDNPVVQSSGVAQADQGVFAGPLAEAPGTEIDEMSEAVRNSGFNWGAFFLPVLWLFSHGKGGVAGSLILFNIASNIVGALSPGMSILFFVVGMGISLHFGATGNEIAWKHRAYRTLEELRRGQRGWKIAGLIVGLGLVTPLTIASFVALASM